MIPDFKELTPELQGLVDKARQELLNVKGKDKVKDGRSAILAVAGHYACTYVDSAMKADVKAPDGAPWLDTVLACNAAQNLTVREIVKQLAHLIYEKENA